MRRTAAYRAAGRAAGRAVDRAAGRATRGAAWLAAGLLLAAALLAPPAAAQKGGAKRDTPAPPEFTGLQARLEDLHLTLSFPAELALAAQAVKNDAQLRGHWTGTLGGSALDVELRLLGRGEFGLDEPEDVLALLATALADPTQGGDAGFRFEERVLLAGSFGHVSYGALGLSSTAAKLQTGADATPGTVRFEKQAFHLGGMLEDTAYVLAIECKPGLPETDAALVRAFLERGVVFDGPQRDPKWSKAEAQERWAESVHDPEKMELEDVLRTAHYIILTNSSGGKTFAKKMEECYAAIRKVYHFEEVAGQRLMPVFLFQNREEYNEFFAKAFHSTVEMAQRSGGVASGDFYATWYEAPGDPVHIHEATHQIFGNRLGLRGGGSWFQEGVAQYMSTTETERGDAARAVKKGRHTPLRQFFAVESLLFSAPAEDKSGEDLAGNQYDQAALLVEFLRESKFGKAAFQEYIHAVGAVPRSDVRAIEAALKRVYGVDIAGLEQQFAEYCKKR